MASLQELKKKKALQNLTMKATQRQFQGDLDEGQKLKAQHAAELGDVMRHEKKPNLMDKPMYQELNKLSPLEKLDMMRKSMDAEGPQKEFKEETEEERKRRMLENMFSVKGQKLS